MTDLARARPEIRERATWAQTDAIRVPNLTPKQVEEMTP